MQGGQREMYCVVALLQHSSTQQSLLLSYMFIVRLLEDNVAYIMLYIVIMFLPGGSLPLALESTPPLM